MSSTIKKVSLTATETTPPSNYLNVLGAITVECTVRIGTLNLTINELRQLKKGQVLSLEQKTDTPVELLVHNQIIATGELLCVGDHFAIRIMEVSS